MSPKQALFIASALVATTVSAAVASPVEYRIAGTITEAQFLSFAAINGNIIQQFPRAGDLPIPFTGRLELDPAASFARLTLAGSFTSPTFTTLWNVNSPNVFSGVAFQALGGPIVVNLANDDLVLSFAASPGTQSGQFSFRDIGAVPASTPRDVLAVGTINSVTVVPSPGSIALLSAGVLAASRSQRRR